MPSLRAIVVTLVLVWASPAFAGQGAALLRLVPEEVELVAALNVSKARGTPLFREAMALLRARAGAVWEGFAKASFDPASDLDTVLIAGMTADPAAGRTSERFVVVFEGRLRGLSALLLKESTERRDGFTIWRDPSADSAAFLVGDRLVVCSSALLGDALAVARGKRPSAKSSRRAQVLRAGVAALGARVDAWGVISGAAIKSPLPVSGKLEWLGLSVATSAGVALELRAGTDSEASAEALAAWLGDQLDQLRPWLSAQGFKSVANSLELKHTGSVAGVSAVVSAAEVESALESYSQLPDAPDAASP